MNDPELVAWAAAQPVAYKVVGDRLMLLPEQNQSLARLVAMRRITEGVFGGSDQASAWMMAPLANLEGLSPADLASESEEGSQLALRALIRWHRSARGSGDG